jgi:uncharacterized protein (TIGR02246 family)
VDAKAVAAEIYSRLERAWNAGDGEAFAEPFTDDADFVDIRGTHHRTRAAIAQGHQGIFASIYKGSVIRYEVSDARALGEDVVLAHGSGFLKAPTGPLAGEHSAVQTLVLVRHGESWRITAFHNTLVAEG